MKILEEFKQFAIRGNVMDLAVGVVIGAGFGKIVSSLVSDVIMPPIGLVVGGVKFTDLKFILKQANVDAAGREMPAVTLNIGNFLQAVMDFAIIAVAIFMVVKATNALVRKQAEEPPAQPPALSVEQKLLTEIRDLLKERK